MSSTIKLYEHNQKAYDALLDMLGERDRACVIKPTGTGKFVIIAKMVQDNPDKRFLLLGTNDYMFNDQMANLAEIAPGFTPENLQFMTYSAAMMTARRGEEISGYDVVVADEFHHCGAEEWGKGVTHILDANESAKVVGFSATPIRYSDGGRNMADEMFDGNVAYSMELEEAWLRGILPIPKYVTAFYEAPKELGRLALPCDESGRIDDGYGNEPNATVAYLSSLEGSREERAFELAKNEYLAWLEHKADRYTTVYGYMD